MTSGIKALTEKSKSKKANSKYQPTFPLDYDGNNGPYRSVDSLVESLQRNFEILLLTHPGSWPMNPAMGIGLESYLFESHNTGILLGLQAKITSQLAMFLPSVQLMKVELLSTEDQRDSSFMNVRLIYSILGKTTASSTTSRDSSGDINLETGLLDKDASSFRDRATKLQSHMTEI